MAIKTLTVGTFVPTIEQLNDKKVLELSVMRPELTLQQCANLVFNTDVHVPPTSTSYVGTLEKIKEQIEATKFVSSKTGRYITDMEALANATSDYAYNQVLASLQPQPSNDIDTTGMSDDEIADLVDMSDRSPQNALAEQANLYNQINQNEVQSNSPDA